MEDEECNLVPRLDCNIVSIYIKMYWVTVKNNSGIVSVDATTGCRHRG